ncbi:MAG: exodeoxyribonuclease V subunit gamma, partial [Lautropia mirabilis]
MPQPDIAPGFIVIHGNQSETLRDLICDWMRAHPLAPLENEVILVQSNGIAQWLTLSLAADPLPVDAGRPAFDGRGLGIAAAIDLQLPSRFIWQAYRAVLGEDQVPERSPFGKDLLTWRLMRLLPA